MRSTATRSLLSIVAILVLPLLAGAQIVPETQPSTQPATRPSITPVLPPDLPDRPGRPGAPAGTPAAIAAQVAAAHGVEQWRAQDAVQTDMTLRFGGRTLIDGTMLYDLRGGRVRIELDGGGVMVFDGERAWVAPKEAEVDRARFHLLTWPYFLAAPFKLADPGTRLAFGRLRPVDGTLAQTLKLTFEPGTGDTPDDWYVCYVHPQTHRLLAMAYIVTYGTPVAEAEQEPHAIIYRGWQTIDGVTISTDWTFTHWNEAEGIHGEPIGSVKLANVRFVEPKQGAFDKPEGAREDERPG